MISKIRQSFRVVGGLEVVAAFIAIGWGLNRLQQVAEKRQEHLDALQSNLQDVGEDLRRTVAERNLLAADDRRVEPHPAREDVDPLGRGDSDV